MQIAVRTVDSRMAFCRRVCAGAASARLIARNARRTRALGRRTAFRLNTQHIRVFIPTITTTVAVIAHNCRTHQHCEGRAIDRGILVRLR